VPQQHKAQAASECRKRRALLMASSAAWPCAMTGMVITGLGVMLEAKVESGTLYTHSVMRSCTYGTQAAVSALCNP
jgi:predicted anti-sigma-YlaC factor YlaD